MKKRDKNNLILVIIIIIAILLVSLFIYKTISGNVINVKSPTITNPSVSNNINVSSTIKSFLSEQERRSLIDDIKAEIEYDLNPKFDELNSKINVKSNLSCSFVENSGLAKSGFDVCAASGKSCLMEEYEYTVQKYLGDGHCGGGSGRIGYPVLTTKVYNCDVKMNNNESCVVTGVIDPSAGQYSPQDTQELRTRKYLALCCN